MGLSLAGRSLVSIADLSREEIAEIMRVSAEQKAGLRAEAGGTPALPGAVPREQLLRIARGRALAMIFDKSSLRTRIGFEVAMSQLGGHAVYLAPGDVRIGERELASDVARVLGRTVDAIVARLSSHALIQEFAESAGVPVINAMSNLEHPCQALADMLTIQERKGKLAGVEVAWLGDGYNVCQSLILICAICGANLRVATPATYEPQAGMVAKAEELAKQTGAALTLGNDPHAAAKGADVISTDVWISAGMEGQAHLRRVDFQDFQVNRALMAEAKPDAIVLHCLPAHRGEEITDEVLDGPQCAAFDQAENRLHTQRALLSLMLG